ncbi:hypothetical protein SALBM217S_04312 [Streptomyces griseoloalbus]
MTSQSMPFLAPWRTWSMTRYLPALLYWVWMWWSPASHRKPLAGPLPAVSRSPAAGAVGAVGAAVAALPDRTVPAARPAPRSPVWRSSAAGRLFGFSASSGTEVSRAAGRGAVEPCPWSWRRPWWW